MDTDCAGHADMRIHTISVFTLAKGSIISGLLIQKRNARSSTEIERNGADDKISKISLTKKFID